MSIERHISADVDLNAHGVVCGSMGITIAVNLAALGVAQREG